MDSYPQKEKQQVKKAKKILNVTKNSSEDNLFISNKTKALNPNNTDSDSNSNNIILTNSTNTKSKTKTKEIIDRR